MQTKQKIQQLLAAAGTSPNKKLGQNFLIDLNLMQLLIDSAHIHPNDLVLEVGCATGSLTQNLAEKAAHVIAVEYDDTLVKIAKNQLSNKDNITLLNTDILENKNTIASTVIDAIEKTRQTTSGQFILIANLPYNTASPLMMNLITGEINIDRMHVTVQKEVADRMVAQPGTSSYGTLSILLAAVGNTKIERILKPTVFWPKPKVDSAIVTFIAEKEKIAQVRDKQLLKQIVGLFMQHRRKMLKPCTKFAQKKLAQIHNWSTVFEDCGINPHDRPEQLSPEDFVSIANICFEYLQKGK